MCTIVNPVFGFQSRAKGGIYFHAIEEVYVDHQTNVKSDSRVTFCMKTSDRKYVLMAPSPEAMRIWVDVIFTGALLRGGKLWLIGVT